MRNYGKRDRWLIVIALTLNEFLHMQGLTKTEFGLILGYPKASSGQNVNKMTEFIFVDTGTEWKVYSERKGRTFVLPKDTSHCGQDYKESQMQENNSTSPKTGEWWMLKSKDTMRISPVLKTDDGWCSILNASGKPLKSFTANDLAFDVLYKITTKDAKYQEEP